MREGGGLDKLTSIFKDSVDVGGENMNVSFDNLTAPQLIPHFAQNNLTFFFSLSL